MNKKKLIIAGITATAAYFGIEYSKQKSQSNAELKKVVPIYRYTGDFVCQYTCSSSHLYNMLHELLRETVRILALENRTFEYYYFTENGHSFRNLCLTLEASASNVTLLETEHFKIVGDKNLRISLEKKEVNGNMETSKMEEQVLRHTAYMLTQLLLEVREDSFRYESLEEICQITLK